MIHPFSNLPYIESVTLPALERGLAKAGRSRDDFELSYSNFVVTGRDQAEFDASMTATKKRIAFYGSTPAYRPVLEMHGWGDLQTELNRMSKQGKWVEMGEVITDEEVAERLRTAALGAGASFIVSPTLDADVVSECVDRGVAVFPGALTPQEIDAAWRAGASMVKVFPAGFFGPSYFREIKGPFANIELLACGGVSASTLGEYARCGSNAFAFGGSVFNQDWIREGHYDRIEAAISELVSALPSD